MNIPLKTVRWGTTLALAAAIASANPIITIAYDPTVDFTAADKTQIQDAVNFFTSNMTSNVSLTLAFGGQAGGGASTSSSSYIESYSAYYSALVANSSGNATDLSAIASLGGPSVNNPVTGSSNIKLSTTLAATLGLDPQFNAPLSGCDNLTATACIQVGTNVLNASGTPMASLMGTVEHEVDEVFGTSSALPGGGGTLPDDPSAADLFRYGASGVRSFAFNSSTDVPCTGSPTAYFSINSGVTNLNDYNNCNNGGDYGDWLDDSGTQVQDAFGPDDVASSLNLNSPEVTLLDAVGYNFDFATTAAPEPSSALFLLLAGLGAVPMLRKRLAGKSRS